MSDEARCGWSRLRRSMVVCLLPVIGAALPGTGIAEEPAADEELAAAVKSLQGTVERLTATRDALAIKLGARAKADAAKGPNQDFVLRFQEGADGDEAHFTIRRRGGAWVDGYAAVPAWRQQGFNQMFLYVHRGRNKCAIRDPLRYPSDAAGLSFDGFAWAP